VQLPLPLRVTSLPQGRGLHINTTPPQSFAHPAIHYGGQRASEAQSCSDTALREARRPARTLQAHNILLAYVGRAANAQYMLIRSSALLYSPEDYQCKPAYCRFRMHYLHNRPDGAARADKGGEPKRRCTARRGGCLCLLRAVRATDIHERRQGNGSKHSD